MSETRSDIVIATILSEPRPQQGQDHRSSGNFGTETVPGGFDKFVWEVGDVESPSAVSFDVMEDVSGGTDPYHYHNLTDGSVTPIKKYRSLYIANPRGAHRTFRVTVYASNTAR